MDGIILRLARELWITGKALAMGRGLWVIKELLEGRKKGFYGNALIKNRRYLPKGVHGDIIKDYFR